MTNHEHYFGTPEAVSRMEVRFFCCPIRVTVWVTEPMVTATTCSQLIKEFTGVRDYLSWLESEYQGTRSQSHPSKRGAHCRAHAPPRSAERCFRVPRGLQ